VQFGPQQKAGQKKKHQAACQWIGQQYPTNAYADTLVKASDEREHIGILILYLYKRIAYPVFSANRTLRTDYENPATRPVVGGAGRVVNPP